MPCHPSEKIVPRETLATIVRDVKRRGATIVTTNGSFDLLHVGHVAMLQEAKSLGDVLIVGLNSDASVKRYKGRTRPICPQEHRANMLAALECTDYITIFDELTPVPLLEIIRPDIHVNSPEHGCDCIERDVVERHGGRIHLAQLIEGMSTSQLIQRIVEAVSHESCQAIFLDHSVLVQDEQEDTLAVLHQFQKLGFQLFLLEPADKRTRQQVQRLLSHLDMSIISRSSSLTTRDTLDTLIDNYDMSLAKSFLISSKMEDIQAGREINCKTILIQRPVQKKNEVGAPAPGPNYAVNSLHEAVTLLSKSGSLAS